MSLEGMRHGWEDLFTQAQEFYELARPSLIEAVELDLLAESRRLDEMLLASEEIRRNADAVLVGALGDEYRLISSLLIAAASVDAMLAADLVTLSSEHGAERRHRVAEGEESPSVLDEERMETLMRVDGLFRGEELPLSTGGALPNDRRQLVETTHATTSRLVELAMIPSPQLLRGLGSALTGGAVDVLSAVQHVDLLADLEGAAAAVVDRSPRFVREHVAKILTLRAEAGVVGQVLNGLIVRSPLEHLFTQVAACDQANLRTEGTIAAAVAIDAGDAGRLEAELRALLPDYRVQMDSMETSAKWLRRGAVPLSHLLAPLVGHAALCGVFVVGIGYGAYSLADRVDARPLGFADRIPGVVTLVERAI